MKNHFYYRNRELYCENIPLKKIADETGTPVYVYSKRTMVERVREYDAAFAGVPHIVCYAVKANSNPVVLKIVFGEGAGADVASGGELYRSLKAGADPGKVVFAGIGKTREEIEYAARSGIMMFNAESLEELDEINAAGMKFGKKLNVSFRINPDINPHTHEYITTGREENKFGIPYADAPAAYRYASGLRGVKIAGMHCHIGSQITSTAPFKLMAKRLAGLARQLETLGIRLRHIDIGGGLGVKYRDEKPPRPADLSAVVVSLIKPYCETVVTEPGRFIVAESGILVARVLYRKRGARKNFIVVDAGMTDIVRPTLYGAYHEIVPLKKQGRADRLPSDVVGPVCESGDFLGKDRRLPLPPRGAYLAVMNAGAYGFAMSSQYNSHPRAAEALVDGNKWKVVRRRETYADLDI
jgi:diaminopimelate decarboxylase